MLELKGITKVYPAGDGKVEALKGIDLKFRKSEFVSILGPSGCGKTTLLNIIGGLDQYTSGDLVINGVSTKNYRDRDWDTYRVALKTVAAMSVVTFAIAFPLATPIAHLFADGSETVVAMAVRGMFIFAAAFLLMGINLFASGFFTALNDGKTSAILSLFRTLIFLMIPLLILPKLWGVDGVWISMPTAEVLSVLLSVFYFRRLKGQYRYA